MSCSFIGVALDCADAAAVARFWAAVLGREVAHESTAERASVLAAADNPSLGPLLTFHQVPEGKTVKNRVHIDVGTSDYEADCERLESLGATRINRLEKGSFRWTTYADIEGNEFDLVAR